MSVGHSPLLVGTAGCGKTQIIKGLLKDLVEKTDDYLSQVINMNYYTDATTLRSNLMTQLEKQGGTRYGPVGKFTLIYFIDDLNMPRLDPFNTQSAIALLRQVKDYNHWYDLSKGI
jgi:dynein heavy chain